MPELGRENLDQAYRAKFIRKGPVIYFSENSNLEHTDINHEYLPNVKVDDAGILDRGVGGKIIAVGGSSDLGISDFNDGRTETDELLYRIQTPIR